MKRIVLIFGLVLGAGLCINMFYTVYLCMHRPEFQSNAVVGYAAIVVVFSLTFFGVRNYRDRQPDGVISLGKAFKTGALIVLVASTLYVVVWLFYYYLFVPDFLDKYIQHAMYGATKDGATASELAAKTQEMEKFREMYKNPIMVILLTYMEVLPVGLVVSFVGALFLKRKKKAIG